MKRVIDSCSLKSPGCLMRSVIGCFLLVSLIKVDLCLNTSAAHLSASGNLRQVSDRRQKNNFLNYTSSSCRQKE